VVAVGGLRSCRLSGSRETRVPPARTAVGAGAVGAIGAAGATLGTADGPTGVIGGSALGDRRGGRASAGPAPTGSVVRAAGTLRRGGCAGCVGSPLRRSRVAAAGARSAPVDVAGCRERVAGGVGGLRASMRSRRHSCGVRPTSVNSNCPLLTSVDRCPGLVGEGTGRRSAGLVTASPPAVPSVRAPPRLPPSGESRLVRVAIASRTSHLDHPMACLASGEGVGEALHLAQPDPDGACATAAREWLLEGA